MKIDFNFIGGRSKKGAALKGVLRLFRIGKVDQPDFFSDLERSEDLKETLPRTFVRWST